MPTYVYEHEATGRTFEVQLPYPPPTNVEVGGEPFVYRPSAPAIRSGRYPTDRAQIMSGAAITEPGMDRAAASAKKQREQKSEAALHEAVVRAVEQHMGP